MRILELTNYTKGACGVGKRVMTESELLSEKGHTVKIFSSNRIKGSKGTCKSFEKINHVEIVRFPSIKLGGESFIFWNFVKKAKEFNPDIIIAHSYRHVHTIKALRLSKKLRVPCILVTHAPFERKNTRNWFENLSVKLYDYLIGKNTINRFSHVLMIAPWELNHLIKLGISKNKLSYSPNGLKEEFFNNVHSKDSNSLVYLGRIAPIKNLEVLIKSISLMNKKTDLLIRGPAEKAYLKKLISIIKKNRLDNRVKIIDKEYGFKEQIKILDSSGVFILPSKSEGMPQSLIEAMARGKIVVGSDITSLKSIISNGKNGFLFKENNESNLAEKLDSILLMSKSQRSQIRKSAIESVKRFKWPLVIKDIEGLFRKIKNERNKEHS